MNFFSFRVERISFGVDARGLIPHLLEAGDHSMSLLVTIDPGLALLRIVGCIELGALVLAASFLLVLFLTAVDGGGGSRRVSQVAEIHRDCGGHGRVQGVHFVDGGFAGVGGGWVQRSGFVHQKLV